MHPILFEIGSWPVYSYGVLLALAYLGGLQLAVVRARRAGLDDKRIMDLGIYLIIAALVGAKLMLVVVDFEYFRDRPRELLSLARVEGVLSGGLIVALRAESFLVRRYKLAVGRVAEMSAAGVVPALVIGQFRGLRGGCCRRRQTTAAWG